MHTSPEPVRHWFSSELFLIGSFRNEGRLFFADSCRHWTCQSQCWKDLYWIHNWLCYKGQKLWSKNLYFVCHEMINHYAFWSFQEPSFISPAVLISKILAVSIRVMFISYECHPHGRNQLVLWEQFSYSNRPHDATNAWTSFDNRWSPIQTLMVSNKLLFNTWVWQPSYSIGSRGQRNKQEREHYVISSLLLHHRLKYVPWLWKARGK